MDRTKFYNAVLVDNVWELDFLHNTLSGFVMNYRPTYYRVSSSDFMRPWIISKKCYGVVDFWWVILLVNGIDNPFTDLIEGMVLAIPSKLDIYDFQKKYRTR